MEKQEAYIVETTFILSYFRGKGAFEFCWRRNEIILRGWNRFARKTEAHFNELVPNPLTRPISLEGSIDLTTLNFMK